MINTRLAVVVIPVGLSLGLLAFVPAVQVPLPGVEGQEQDAPKQAPDAEPMVLSGMEALPEALQAEMDMMNKPPPEAPKRKSVEELLEIVAQRPGGAARVDMARRGVVPKKVVMLDPVMGVPRVQEGKPTGQVASAGSVGSHGTQAMLRVGSGVAEALRVPAPAALSITLSPGASTLYPHGKLATLVPQFAAFTLNGAAVSSGYPSSTAIAVKEHKNMDLGDLPLVLDYSQSSAVNGPDGSLTFCIGTAGWHTLNVDASYYDSKASAFGGFYYYVDWYRDAVFGDLSMGDLQASMPGIADGKHKSFPILVYLLPGFHYFNVAFRTKSIMGTVYVYRVTIDSV